MADDGDELGRGLLQVNRGVPTLAAPHPPSPSALPGPVPICHNPLADIFGPHQHLSEGDRVASASAEADGAGMRLMGLGVAGVEGSVRARARVVMGEGGSEWSGPHPALHTYTHVRPHTHVRMPARTHAPRSSAIATVD